MTIGEFFRQLTFRLRGARFDDDLTEEMRLHMDLRAAEKQASGLSSDDSQAAARRQFGNATLLKEASRDAWGWTLLDTLKQDLRYGARALAANPGFTATAVLSLALGIGANTAIFSIINAVMLRSLPVADPQALVQIKLGTGADDELSTPIWEQIRDHQQAFSGVLAYSPERFDLAGGGESHWAQGTWVSGGFFGVLGVPALLGRTFTTGDDRWGGGQDGAVAVISYSFWKRNFPGDNNIIGKTIQLNRQRFAIVGVTPPWFTGLDVDHGYDVAVPIGCLPILHANATPSDEVFHWWLRILGRIPSGATLQQVDDRMRAIAAEVLRASLVPDQSAHDQEEFIKQKFVLRPAGWGFSATRIQYRTALYVLMAASGLVLLIACANIANLLLARATARQRELSVRMAIGASRTRVLRQLMTESLLLAMMGAAGGFLLALYGSRVLIHMLSTSSNAIDIDTAPDLNLLAFNLSVAILTAFLFGLVPAIRASRIGLNHVLKENEHGTVRGSSRMNLGKALVAGQVALSVVLLAAAGLFMGTLRNLLTVDPGFNRHNILLVTTTLEQTTTAPQRVRIYRAIREQLQSMPGVVSAASSVLTPISPQGWMQPTAPEGFTAKSPRETAVYFNRVSPDYFKTMRTPLLLGRDFNERDDTTSLPVMVINESTAKRFFGSANPLGKTIGLGKRGSRREMDLYHVIGVVKDSRYNRLNEQPRRIAYLTSEQEPAPGPDLRYSVHTVGPVEALIPAIRSAVSALDPGISLEFRNFETQVVDSLLQPRIVALLSSLFASLALILSMVGLYGITTYSVTRRRSEIGIRMALGAEQRAVIWMMVRDVAIFVAIGISLGLAAALGAGQLIGSLLFGVRPNDPLQMAAAVLVLAIATGLAAYIPARRAAQLDPATTLRDE